MFFIKLMLLKWHFKMALLQVSLSNSQLYDNDVHQFVVQQKFCKKKKQSYSKREREKDGEGERKKEKTIN